MSTLRNNIQISFRSDFTYNLFYCSYSHPWFYFDWTIIFSMQFDACNKIKNSFFVLYFQNFPSLLINLKRNVYQPLPNRKSHKLKDILRGYCWRYNESYPKILECHLHNFHKNYENCSFNIDLMGASWLFTRINVIWDLSSHYWKTTEL